MTTPICRCRVMYLGSAVPHVTKDGLQGIQEPLRDLYPENGVTENGTFGIDSWVSVWSNGILIENVDDNGREVKRFFPIESLHYCAAVRYVMVPSTSDAEKTPEKVSKFLPLDSPFLRNADTKHPPLFACILRRTAGIKVLECHAFVCKREPAANALVRCCFHAYADSIYAKQIEENPYSQLNGRRSRSISALDTVDKRHDYTSSEKDGTPESSRFQNGHSSKTPSEVGANSTISQSPDEDNYKVWPGVAPLEREAHSSVRSPKVRQMIIPSVLPPPPPLPPLPIPLCAEKIKGFSNSLKKRKKKQKQNGLLPLVYPPPHIIGNGYPVNFMSVPQLHPQGPAHPIYAPASSVYSISRRLKRGPQVIAPEMPIVYGASEEPLYIPPMRPLTPLSNYPQQIDPHYVQFPVQTYGTSRKERSKKEKRKDSNCESESPFNTGIYRKKGHLNERAFSYSIRQEHRSRSNSLANIQFTNDEKRSQQSDYSQERLVNGHSSHSAPVNGQNGSRFVPKESLSDVKREKELSQSLSSLHINGTNHTEVNNKVMKTASIKRGKQNGSATRMPIAPPVPAPPPMPPMVNGKTVSSESMQNAKRTNKASNGKQRKS
ncbi:uncharacterized protein B4U79_15748 [Dinothrombium tinctorium]|uniref:PID domain-containing protein n=1 Tax=Dinothrombium tinctorium TaxID=1965070 RepID=A0A443RPF9_9ACAR|nr:uncharacterized protein B4U79_01944 [Dinothrombium tinctorium]RWS17173.1 uncharacterized protein B4U79_15748 [Dinothrombium tinctorium]